MRNYCLPPLTRPDAIAIITINNVEFDDGYCLTHVHDQHLHLSEAGARLPSPGAGSSNPLATPPAGYHRPRHSRLWSVAVATRGLPCRAPRPCRARRTPQFVLTLFVASRLAVPGDH